MALEAIESLSKTTKLLLLDSLLQEVCIESGSDGSLAQSSLRLSVCLVSHNLLYSGLKKAHSKMKTMKGDKLPQRLGCQFNPHVGLSVCLESVDQPDDGHHSAKGRCRRAIFSIENYKNILDSLFVLQRDSKSEQLNF